MKILDFDSFDVKHQRGGYQDKIFEKVQDCFQVLFPELVNKTELSHQENLQVQRVLMSQFKNNHETNKTLQNQAIFGLCLRCYLSGSIIKTCQNLALKFGKKHGFTYFDLLPIVLTDDGKNLILLDQDGQKIVAPKGEKKKTSYAWFAVEILRKFNPDRPQANLDYWAALMTRQNPALKEELRVTYQVIMKTPWSILNRPNSRFKLLTSGDSAFVKVFRQVYRRDRQGKTGRCPDPNSDQLDEMFHLLEQQDILIAEQATLKKRRAILLEELKQIAEFIRQEELESFSQSSSPPEVIENEDGDEPGLFSDSGESTRELTELLTLKLHQALTQGITEVLSKRLKNLQASRYQKDAPKFYQALQLIYCQGKTQTEVAKLLDLGNQTRLTRFLKLRQMINHIRSRVLNLLLANILNEAQINRHETCCQVDRMDLILNQLEVFIDETIFIKAAKEYRGKNRQMNSSFAQAMGSVVETYLNRKKQ